MAVNPLKPLELVENFSQIFVKFIDIFHKISTTPSINERNGGELATAAINRTTVVATIFRHPHCLRQPPPTTTTLNTTNTNTPTQTNTNTNNIRTTTTTPTTTTPLPALSFSRRRSASVAANAWDASARTIAASALLAGTTRATRSASSAVARSSPRRR